MTNTMNANTNMTISQALRAAKRSRGKIAELTGRATLAVSFEQSNPPTWDFAETCDQLADEKRRLMALEAGVAVANATTTVPFEGREMPIACAIRQLQELKGEMAFLSQLKLRHGTEEVSVGYEWDAERRRDVPQIKTLTYISKLSEQERAAQLESLRDRFEQFNDVVEAANHRTLIPILEI